MTPRRSGLAFLAAGLGFGVAMALLKGEGAGTRNVLGNLSAPWLVLPFLAGRRRSTAATAAALGAGTCVFSFVGFYAAAGIAFGMVNSHTIAYDLGFVASGAVAGPLFGALGFWWRGRRSLLAGCAVGLAFVGEPFAQVWVWRLYGASVDATSVFRHPAVLGLEVALGLVLCGWALRRRGTAPAA